MITVCSLMSLTAQHCLPQRCLSASQPSSTARKPLRNFSHLPQISNTHQLRHSCSFRIRAQQDTQRSQRSIPAPPVRAPPPPPPPPPEPAGREPSRREILTLGLVGFGVSYIWRKSQQTQFYHDQKGRTYIKTAQGNPIQVSQDETGNIVMVDKAGTLYYDTENPQLGIYMVRQDGSMWNLYMDENGEQKMGPLGNIDDLKSVPVSDLGGVPIETIQAQYEELQRQRQPSERGPEGPFPASVLGFPDDTPGELPPNSLEFDPESFEELPGKDGQESDEVRARVRLSPPPILDELQIDPSFLNDPSILDHKLDTAK